MRHCFLLAFLLAALVRASSAADLLPADQPLEAAIDHYVDALLKTDKVAAAPQASDANLIRRLMLDLAGRIPTTSEAQAFVASQSPNKRVELVDQLLASPDFVWHHRNEFDAVLQQPNRQNDEFRKYLLWAVEQNRPWNRMFQDMLAGDESDEHQKRAMFFVRNRTRDIDDITIDTSSLFFGVNVSCAKCHDHPLVEDWKQDHFYGMTSFFSRTYLGKKEGLGENFSGEVKFKTTKGDEKQAKFMFLSGSVIDEPPLERTPEQKKETEEAIKKFMKDDNAPAAPKPEFSPRAKLVEVALRDGDNQFFSKNIVNRLWLRLTGHGLVNPPDQLTAANPPSHPELLTWLARDMISHDYDMKRLLRGIALSQTYSRSSQWDSAGEPPLPKYFAVGIPRAMSPRQYGLALTMASSSPTAFPKADQPAEWKNRREQLEGQANGLAGHFEQPRESFQVAVDEALLFNNSTRMESELLRDSSDRLMGYLKTQPDPAATITAAYWAISSRAPTTDESAAITDYLSKHSAAPADAWKQAIWALMTGPELRFNY